MSLTYSSNQSRQPLSRAAVIAFIVVLHVVVMIAFNNGIGRIFKRTPPNDLTVIQVPVEPPLEKSAPIPEVPKSIPEQVLDTPVVPPQDIVLDVTPDMAVQTPPQDSSAVTGSDVPVIEKLSLSSRVDPVYPASSQRAGQEGTVLLEITVDTNGRALSVQVARSSGFDALDAAAMQAVKQWRFNHPETIVKVHVPITFKLKQR